MPADPVDRGVDIIDALGAQETASIQVLALYIPDKDRDGLPIAHQEKWIHEAATLLAHIGGGVTVLPRCRGGWLNPASGEIVWEEPVKLYTYIKADALEARLSDLRNFLHRLGRNTNQGEVALEFDGVFIRITDFQLAQEG